MQDQKIHPVIKGINNKRLMILLIVGIAIVLLVFAGVYVLPLINFNNERYLNRNTPPPIISPTITPTISLSPTAQVITEPVEYLTDFSNKNYFLQYHSVDFLGETHEYSISDIESGDTYKFIPEGYQMANFDVESPDFLILKKDNNLYSFEIGSQKVNKILDDDQLLKGNELVTILKSFSEENKYYIVINEHDMTDSDTLSELLPILSTRSYTLDLSKEELKQAPDGSFKFDCGSYDSKNQRFIVWRCGEGIGSSTPLSIYDMKGQKIKDLVVLTDFELNQEDQTGAIQVLNIEDGLVTVTDNKTKMIVVDLNLKEPIKEIYKIPNSSILNSINLYGVILNKQSNSLIAYGYADASMFGVLLRRDANNNIIESKIIPYSVDSIYIENEILYFRSKLTKSIYSFDLKTWNEINKVQIKNYSANDHAFGVIKI